jgi:hypothetical protein
MYEDVTSLTLQALYLKLAEAMGSEERVMQFVRAINEVDAELKAKRYVARILCAGCGANVLLKDRKDCVEAHCNMRSHAWSHEGMEKDIFGEPIRSGTYGWTDDVIRVVFIARVRHDKLTQLGC